MAAGRKKRRAVGRASRKRQTEELLLRDLRRAWARRGAAMREFGFFTDEVARIIDSLCELRRVKRS